MGKLNSLRGCALITVAGALLALAGCAKQGSVASYPVAPVPPLAAIPPAARETVGDARDIWRLRSVLNIAALGCQRAGDRNIGPRYNHMLKQHEASLAAAYASEQARYRLSNGAGWQTVQDHEMTALYNRFANLLQASAFCATASNISAEASAVQDGGFAQFAAAALPRLMGGAVLR